MVLLLKFRLVSPVAPESAVMLERLHLTNDNVRRSGDDAMIFNSSVVRVTPSMVSVSKLVSAEIEDKF